MRCLFFFVFGASTPHAIICCFKSLSSLADEVSRPLRVRLEVLGELELEDVGPGAQVALELAVGGVAVLVQLEVTREGEKTPMKLPERVKQGIKIA